jgi:hypothetical protein
VLANPALDYVVQIWSMQGLELYSSRPPGLVGTLPPRAVLGFSEVTLGGEPWRVYGAATPLRVVQVAQPISVRRRLATAAALRSLLPTKTCLLVGLRFDDVSTGDPTHWLTEIFTGSRGPHYVMVRKSEGTLARAALKHLPLTLIEYPDDERALLDGLQRLSRERAR